ncbi:zonular occludens toxin [Ventosimonas gracilis]|uniref:Zonular occludens toxin n=1 Tax=Ventosimonas gracilis TaxID=1680762 RepID=A0A139SRF2_9GAMM|nr:zonular occludens toxin domain-containing protein [Ventosimonas gracilis]KXU37179.1 zonular occludens toxin [Ventosimonas gracilis]
MFVLRTGLQGHGKTLNTIKEVDTKAANEGRAVYYHNIRGFNPDAEVLKAVWLPFDDPYQWHHLPENSIIVIDEAQTFFRIRKQAAAVPEYASALETMRHKGHELHCITQSPGLIDHHFRKLCNSHIHYVRGHKGKVTKRWEFERVNPDVERKNHFQEGEASRVLLDKKYFDVYQSVAKGSEHHMRFKAPKALWWLIACVLILLVGGYNFYKKRMVPPTETAQRAQEVNEPPHSAEKQAPSDGGFLSSDDPRGREPLTLEEYLALRTPRLPDVPSSAPLYDEVTQPVTYPKLSCMATTDVKALERAGNRLSMGWRKVRKGMQDVIEVYGCRCNTQQGTRAMISAEACLNYVENGAFDPAKPDKAPVQATGFDGARAGMLSQAAEPTRPVPQGLPKGSFGALSSGPLVP